MITDVAQRWRRRRSFFRAKDELFSAQGFPGEYNIEPTFNGKPLTKTAKIRLAGNSVCPPVAAALVAANTRHAA